MPPHARIQPLVALVLIAAPVTTFAGPRSLDLVCRVHETRGAAHRDIRRRLDIDLQTKSVRISDDAGRGWTFKNEYPLVSIDSQRIVLEAGEGKDSSVDRVAGIYSFRNRRDGVTMRGPCEKAAPEAGATAKF